MKKRLSWKEIWEVIRDTFTEFFGENSFFHGAALSFYTVIALIPLVYLAFTVIGFFIDENTAVQMIEQTLKRETGMKDVSWVLDFVHNTHFKKSSNTLNILVSLVLLYSSSALLSSLRFSINEFYDVKNPIKSKRKRIEYQIGSKLASIIFIPAFAIILVLFYVGQGFILSLLNYFFGDLSGIEHLFIQLITWILLILLNALTFSLILKFVHDGKVSNKMAFSGGLVTAILFMLGQLVINYYLNNLFFGSKGGVAGTLLVVLSWMYYTSQIIFLGAKFTKIYALKLGQPIEFKARKFTLRKFFNSFKSNFSQK